MKTPKILPPTWMLIAMLLMVALHLVLPLGIIVPNLWNLFGLIPIALGVSVAMAAERAFQNIKTTVTPFKESSVLVTDGMYRFSRNPMYLGFVLVLIGIAILLRSLTPFFIIPAFMVLIQTLFIRAEEQMLAAKFGERYSAYLKNTRRWL